MLQVATLKIFLKRKREKWERVWRSIKEKKRKSKKEIDRDRERERERDKTKKRERDRGHRKIK